MKTKQEKRIRRHKRIRSRVFGTSERPRLSVFRTSKHIYAQLIDDDNGKTLFSARSNEMKSKKSEGKIKLAFATGEEIAKQAVKNNITNVVFDRGGYLFHGRVKALAEGAKKGGLNL